MSSGVEFDEDKIVYGKRAPSGGMAGGQSFNGFNAPNSSDPRMVRWLMRRGIVKSRGTAQAVLVIVIIINIVLTYFVISYFL